MNESYNLVKLTSDHRDRETLFFRCFDDGGEQPHQLRKLCIKQMIPIIWQIFGIMQDIDPIVSLVSLL